jgi:nitrate/TMAO reductase-like tetraheme cytochrome c subunit
MWSSFAAPQVHECPNCHNCFAVGAPQTKEKSKSGERYSLLRGEDYLDTDADAEHYIDASGRPSEEQLRPKDDDKDEGRGKSIIDV